MGVPGFLRKRFEKTGGGFNEYVIFRTQLASIVLFVFAVSLLFIYSPLLLFAVGVLFVLNLYSVFKQLDVRDLNAYKYFFGGINVFGLLIGFSNFFVGGFDLNFSLAIIVFFALFLLLFQFFFRRKHAFGKVLLADDDWAVVHVPYDLCSGVRNGFYAVKSNGKATKGEEVKVEVSGSIGERRVPWRIIN